MSRLREWWSRSGSDPHVDRPESDVPIDPNLASSRATGGEHAYLDSDRGSVTGTGNTGEFVGQIAGDDLGYADETGAERRATDGDTSSTEPEQGPGGATHQ
ncbi:hypothetical protein I4I78_00245 [Pseudonocardia sp. KRD-291]|nr:hypothetical protein [Pseudonocardia sp. KRD291]